MRMLGNSNQGLSPSQKWLLYRLCVVPVATYRYCLWFFIFYFYHIYVMRCSITVLACTKYKSKKTDIKEKGNWFGCSPVEGQTSHMIRASPKRGSAKKKLRWWEKGDDSWDVAHVCHIE
jgi:hypothetical protein